MQQINKIEWSSCGNGVFFHQYINEQNDGFIKIIAGGKKARAKTKTSVLVRATKKFKNNNRILNFISLFILRNSSCYVGN